MLDLCGHWPGHRVAPDSLISTLGVSSPQYELLLCCQTEAEFITMARWMSASFRLHAMRSGHLMIDHGPGSLRQLVLHYLEEIETIDPRGTLLVAGVCQGGVIAQMVAETLSMRGRSAALLILVEPMQPQPYAGHVAVIRGNGSFRNPLRPGGVGHQPFAAGFPKGYTIDLVESSHGDACIEPALISLAQHVVRRLGGVSAAQSGPI